jgi:hypothetical protein
MPRTLANFLLNFCFLSLSFVLGLTIAVPARAQSVFEELRMAQEAEPLRRVADDFIARARAGDAAGAQALFSPNLLARVGEANVQRVMQTQLLPFFAQGAGTGRSVTVARTTDANGSQGFAFYMWLQPTGGGAARPFTLYTVVEQGRAVIANVVPDRMIAGRHQ